MPVVLAPLAPAIPTAVNTIVATGGALLAPAAAPAASVGLGAVIAKVIAFGGAVVTIGGAFIPLIDIPQIEEAELLPEPEPGIGIEYNNPTVSAPVSAGIVDWVPTPPPDLQGQVLRWEVVADLEQLEPEVLVCENNFQLAPRQYTYNNSNSQAVSAIAIRVTLTEAIWTRSCGPSTAEPARISYERIEYLTDEGWKDWVNRTYPNGVQFGNTYETEDGYARAIPRSISVEGRLLEFPQPETEPTPQIKPLKPLPLTEPAPPLEPEPLPEPEPEVQPIVVPTPTTPNAPPYSPPAIPTAPPQTPRQPRPIVAPPGIPVPAPAPGVVPIGVPDPSTAPNPAPVEVPSTQPEPQETPEVTRPTISTGPLAPPTAKPVPVTPKDAHYPVSGGEPVTSAGASTNPVQIAQELGRLEQKAARAMNQGLTNGLDLADILWALSVLYDLFEAPYPGGSYELKGVCELDPDGNPMDVTRSINFPPALGLSAAIERLDALADMFQFAKDLKQPTCRSVSEKPTGEPVTITFRSDLPSPVSGDPVRKLFTYFDQSGRPQFDHVMHWENFSWQAGPVIVAAAGTKLGNPQVWAASEAEGKRVINHAAQIAGVDMTSVNWIVSRPRNQRYGLSGTMRVYVDKGSRIWVTKRDGPDGLPPVYKRT